MEYCRHGDLRHLLQSRRNLPTEEARQITHRILEGLDQMHQNDFAHRDLKPGVRLQQGRDGNLLTLTECSYQIYATRREVVDCTGGLRTQQTSPRG